MKNKTRIDLKDSMIDALAKMANGNPGAINVLMQLAKLDFGLVLVMDTFGIYGTDIWVLYKDICGENISKVVNVLTATQRGKFSSITLADACHRQDYSGRVLVPTEIMDGLA